MLCDRFGWTPEEILRQDPHIIDGLFVIMGAQAEVDKKRSGNGEDKKVKKYIG